jgi:C4-dicarboxylate-binding protein DctP
VSKFGPLGVREFEVFDLPYLFPDTETVDRITDGEIGKALFAKLEARGIRGLAYWDNGFKQFSANRPLREPGDFRGLKMRIQSSKVLEAMVRQLGALPQVMAFSEVYSALQQRVVDGTENPVSNLYTQKMHEVQSHLTISDHGCLVYAVIVNRKFWEGLPAGDRAQLEKAMRETTAYERGIARGGTRLPGGRRKDESTSVESGAQGLEEALLPVHRFEGVVGKEICWHQRTPPKSTRRTRKK